MRDCANVALFVVIGLGLLVWPGFLPDPPGWVVAVGILMWIPLFIAWVMLRTLAYGPGIRGAARVLDDARQGHRWDSNLPCPFVEGTFEGVFASIAVTSGEQLVVELRPAGQRLPSFRLERRWGGVDVKHAGHGTPDEVKTARFVQTSEVEQEVAALFGLGFEWVEASSDRLAAGAQLLLAGPVTREARTASLVGALATLRRLARHAESRELDGGRALLGWTDGGEHVLCPYCRDVLLQPDEAAAALASCPRCRTAHHQVCYEEAGGCTVFACRPGRAVERRAKDA